MRRIFQQKYLLPAIAFLVLALITISVLEPKISEYNSQVRERHEKLLAKANGLDYKKVSFTLYSSTPPRNAEFTFFLTILFLSLILTKRIILSFFAMFLFCAQIFFAVRITSNLRQADLYFSYPKSIYFETFLTACFLSLSFWLALSFCRFSSQKFQSNTFLK